MRDYGATMRRYPSRVRHYEMVFERTLLPKTRQKLPASSRFGLNLEIYFAVDHNIDPHLCIRFLLLAREILLSSTHGNNKQPSCLGD